MNTPPHLQPGSKIRIVAPAGRVSEKYIIPASQWLTQQGYNTVLGQHIFSQHFQFAGTDEQRLHDIQLALDDLETDVIICARGGFGTVRIVDQLDFSAFKKNPKWIIGFSDITVIHSHLDKNLGVASIHSKMCNSFPDDWSQAEPIQIETVESNKQGKQNRHCFRFIGRRESFYVAKSCRHCLRY